MVTHSTRRALGEERWRIALVQGIEKPLKKYKSYVQGIEKPKTKTITNTR